MFSSLATLARSQLRTPVIRPVFANPVTYWCTVNASIIPHKVSQVVLIDFEGGGNEK